MLPRVNRMSRKLGVVVLITILPRRATVALGHFTSQIYPGDALHRLLINHLQISLLASETTSSVALQIRQQQRDQKYFVKGLICALISSTSEPSDEVP